ncbi:MAG: hypothetical protein LCI00_01380 [Chloroflexi bacterium]|nr:hypothetical protein [Chloroflexota bacterium]MCC6895657.1 hypothetical protein [Anaerolineae bacterium]
MRKLIVLLLTLFPLVVTVSAQADLEAITAENVEHLQSVQQINFADETAGAGVVENGWFAVDAQGKHIAAMNRAGDVVVWDDTGNLIDNYGITGGDDLLSTVQDIAFRKDSPEVVSVHMDGTSYYVAYRNYETHELEYFHFSTADVPLRIWDTGNTWLEVSPADYLRTRFVRELLPEASDNLRTNAELAPSEYRELESGPENDPDAFFRIGRMRLPYAITATQEFFVKRWNLETGEVTATAQLDGMPGVGQITPDGRYFAWRDSESEAIHLLDFETGIDKVIAPLNGSYIPYLLLNSSASVIIGVNVDLKSIVVAWDVSTGERIELGEYRSCNRQPDMVRLSVDDTTLVIGCDTGLDIWRVALD